MKSHSHAIFAAVVSVLIVGAFQLDVPLDWTLVVLAAFGGVIPDIDHHKEVWKFVAVGLFFFLAFLFARTLPDFVGGELPGLVSAVFCAAAATWIIYKLQPFRVEIAPAPGHAGVAFATLYALLIFAATWSVAYAFVAFLSLGSHWVLDEIAWKTLWGRRILIRTPDWRKPFEWHLAREAKATGRRMAKRSK